MSEFKIPPLMSADELLSCMIEAIEERTRQLERDDE